MANNILAEFWCMYSEARPSEAQAFNARLSGDSLSTADPAVQDLGSLVQNLVVIKAGGRKFVRIISSQSPPGPGCSLKLKPALRDASGGVRVYSLGFIGSYMVEYDCAMQLLKDCSTISPLFRSILCPRLNLPGEYDHRKLDLKHVPCNPSQKQAIDGLQYALEKIQVRSRVTLCHNT